MWDRSEAGGHEAACLPAGEGSVNLFLHTMPALYTRSWQVVPLRGVELWWCEPVKINTHKWKSVAQQAQTTPPTSCPQSRG